MDKITVLGIDPGLSLTGFALVKSEETIELVKCGIIKTNSVLPISDRLKELYFSLSEILKKEEVDHVAIEKIFFNTNLKTVVSVSEARGVILLAVSEFRKPIYEYTPLEAKKAVLGDGMATKKEIQQSIKFLLELKSEPKPDDAADAVAIALCHIYSLPFIRSLDDRTY